MDVTETKRAEGADSQLNAGVVDRILVRVDEVL
jgi:hypothetical protein